MSSRPGRKITSAKSPMDIAIIGSGFSGLGMGLRLLQRGVSNFTIYESSDSLGGTWRDNTYPGCACDIQSLLYSYSFDQNPNWTNTYPRQPELRRYLEDCADRAGLRPHIRFSTSISELRWDDQTLRWTLHAEGGETFSARVVVNGTGLLSKPVVPELTGHEQFAGTSFHSARWRHEHDLADAKVAVVGTGASAIQFVPEIAPVVKELTVFQRTAPWVLPREDAEFTAWQKWTFRWVPLRQRIRRWKLYWRQEMLGRAMLGDKRVTAQIKAGGREFIEAQIPDNASLRDTVTPTFEPGCKRLLISNDWYPALTRDNVNVVTEPIDRLTKSSIITTDGVEHEVDTIIYGTGFAATDFLAPMKIFGRDGIELNDEWSDGAPTHLGITASGFPNFFMLLGPNTGLGHNSVVLMIESQINYVLAALDHLAESDGGALDLLAGVQRSSDRWMQRKMKRTIWQTGCRSWYLSDDGRNYTLWPSYAFVYWWKTRRFQPDTFALLG